jgi:serine/threonine-protein kinase
LANQRLAKPHWPLAMPRAERSLRVELNSTGGPVEVEESVAIVTDVATALAALAGRVVHRELKPENILLLEGAWCLADFGIARYAESTTASNTWKDFWSAPYAAPERWQHQRATGATDVYSLGVMTFEMLTGRLPFLGPDRSDFRDQHLREDAAPLSGVPAALAGLVTECLFKEPGARPSAANLLARLGRISTPPSRGAAALQAANAAARTAEAEAQARASAAALAEDRRSGLLRAAKASFVTLSSILREAIEENAPAATLSPRATPDDWSYKLGEATLGVDPPRFTPLGAWGHPEWAPSFEVIAQAAIGIQFPADRSGYQGRNHSLWYCDAKEPGIFRWYETAFMVSPLIPKRFAQEPMRFDPGEEAGKALWRGMAEWQLAWPFTPVDQGEEGEFVDRWIEWFGLASAGNLHHPSSMPERQAEGSWRR